MRRVSLHRLGLTNYEVASVQQTHLVHRLKQRAAAAELHPPQHLLLLQHPPVFTLGKLQSSRQNVLASADQVRARGATIEQSGRGGNVTFHGPGQLVAYPILDLNRFQRSVRWYVHALEDVLIDTAAAFGVRARRGGENETGVWVDDRKLAAIGVQVSRWITSHGVALNASTDLSYFDMIIPCGLREKPQVTSLSRELSRVVSVEEASTQFEASFARVFEAELIRTPPLPGVGRERSAEPLHNTSI